MSDFPGDLPLDYPSDKEWWWYSAPAIECKNPINQRYSSDKCRKIPLPFPNLPGEFDDLPYWPPDKWKQTFVCIDCGQVYEYDAEDVDWVSLRKSSQARFRNETNCFCVKAECAQKGCAIPVQFHIEIFDETEDDLMSEIKDGFVGHWSCGHPALIAPHKPPKIERVYLGPI